MDDSADQINWELEFDEVASIKLRFYKLVVTPLKFFAGYRSISITNMEGEMNLFKKV